MQEVLGLCAVPGPKLLKRCRLEKKDMNEYGHMLKIILKLEEGRVPDRSLKRWNVERVKKESQEERVQEVEGII